MAKYGFIGMGNMGYAMMNALLKLYPASDFVFSDASGERASWVTARTKVEAAQTNAECANQSQVVVLAVKPQFFDAVLKNIKYAVKPEQVIVSIAPGITVESIQKKLGDKARIVRAMPNTPALLGEGITGISYDEEAFSEEERQLLRQLFEAVGAVEVVPEWMLDAVVCASGSSPAYVYMFIEALADSVVKCGMPRDKAYTFAAWAVRGAAQMVLDTGKHPGELKDQVCSPAGTTIAGVEALEEYGFRNAVMKATEACYAKVMDMKKG